MDSTYRPQSPDLSSYAPKSPDLSGLRPQTPEDSQGAFPSPRFGHHQHSLSREFNRFGAPAFGGSPFQYGASPTSVPPLPQHGYQPQQQFGMPPTTRGMKAEYREYDEDDEFLPEAPPKRIRTMPQSLPNIAANGSQYDGQHSQLTAPLQGMSTQPVDPTLGVQLKTSFPVARIKRIMQADEDVGKVAQVTPHVVSRALELFMIKLITASAEQARGPTGGGGGGKGPKKVLAQHVKKAIVAEDTFDFLSEIIAKVPDAPVKAKKEAGSDSEDGGAAKLPMKKKGRKKKDSMGGDD